MCAYVLQILQMFELDTDKKLLSLIQLLLARFHVKVQNKNALRIKCFQRYDVCQTFWSVTCKKMTHMSYERKDNAITIRLKIGTVHKYANFIEREKSKTNIAYFANIWQTTHVWPEWPNEAKNRNIQVQRPRFTIQPDIWTHDCGSCGIPLKVFSLLRY